MKKTYIKPISEVECIQYAETIFSGSVPGLTTTVDDADGPGFGGLGNASDDPDVKADMFSDNPFE